MNKIQISPKLAGFKKINKYLKKIDVNRYYSNFGPLYKLTKQRILKDYNIKDNSIIFTSSGHASIQACCNYLKEQSKKKYVLFKIEFLDSNDCCKEKILVLLRIHS